MSAADRAKELQLKEKFSVLGAPPARDEIKGNLSDALIKARPGRKRKAEKMAQLNLRVPEEVKHALREIIDDETHGLAALLTLALGCFRIV